MKERICIAPFTKQENVIYNNCPKEFEIVGVIAPKAYDIESFNCLKNLCDVFYYEFEEVQISFETVVITAVSKEDDEELYNLAIQLLYKAVELKKNIICYLDIDKNLYIQLKKKTEKNNCYFLNKTKIYNTNKEDLKEKYIPKKFNVPIIFIGELMPDLNGYEIFIKLMNRLKDDNLLVLGISNDIYNSFWNQYTIDFNLDNLSVNSINQINHSIYKFYKEQSPDIILIKFPMPIMKYDDENVYDYGLSAYAISQSIQGTCGICCSFSGTPIAEFWDNVNQSIMSKFGFPLFGVHIDKKRIDFTMPDKIETVTVSKELIIEELKYLNEYNNLNFYDLLEDRDFEELYQEIKKEFLMIEYGVI